MDKVKQFAMPILQKAKDFLASCSPTDLVILSVIVLIPILAIILAVVGKKNRRRRKNVVYVDRPVCCRRRDMYYRPRKRRVRYIKTYASKAVKELANQKKLYCKLDQSTLMATGLFGLGLGMMIHKSSVQDNRRDYY